MLIQSRLNVVCLQGGQQINMIVISVFYLNLRKIFLEISYWTFKVSEKISHLHVGDRVWFVRLYGEIIPEL